MYDNTPCTSRTDRLPKPTSISVIVRRLTVSRLQGLVYCTPSLYSRRAELGTRGELIVNENYGRRGKASERHEWTESGGQGSERATGSSLIASRIFPNSHHPDTAHRRTVPSAKTLDSPRPPPSPFTLLLSLPPNSRSSLPNILSLSRYDRRR